MDRSSADRSSREHFGRRDPDRIRAGLPFANELAEFIRELSILADDLDVNEVLRDINEDRIRSGFPEIRAVDQIESELSERKRYFRSAI